MRLHEWYKCDHCPDFHPVEVHNYAKAFSYNMIFRRSEKEIEEHVPKQKRWRYNLRMEHNLLKRIILTIGPHELVSKYFQKLDQSIVDYKRFLGNIDASSYKEELLKELYEFGALHTLVKSVKANKRVCANEWQGAYESASDSSPRRIVELCVSEPSKQWMEITGMHLKLQVKPIWYVGNRVYQFITRIMAPSTYIRDLDRFSCKIMVDGKLEPVLTFEVHYHSNWLSDDEPMITRNTKLYLLSCQTKFFKLAFTGKVNNLSNNSILKTSSYVIRIATVLLRQ